MQRDRAGGAVDRDEELRIREPGGEGELDRFARGGAIESVGEPATDDEPDVAAAGRWAVGAAGERAELVGVPEHDLAVAARAEGADLELAVAQHQLAVDAGQRREQRVIRRCFDPHADLVALERVADAELLEQRS